MSHCLSFVLSTASGPAPCIDLGPVCFFLDPLKMCCIHPCLLDGLWPHSAALSSALCLSLSAFPPGWVSVECPQRQITTHLSVSPDGAHDQLPPLPAGPDPSETSSCSRIS